MKKYWNHFSDMVIITDGIVGIKNAHTLDSIIQQLRATTVACSFLRVGSMYDPHCADGLVPYQDLLYFIAAATLGSYMSFSSYIVRKFFIYLVTLLFSSNVDCLMFYLSADTYTWNRNESLS